ncbi:unnamed protein product [Nyctereutes procyonoides]|uniref:(raccoon dog) hypothetical protein n=1 Tax=Nyctereutes procyonoides TaxID=34880 RepID=A0A811YEM1_NYCPR|nr:unnamed protein product [Nyctereutes procyonoides]
MSEWRRLRGLGELAGRPHRLAACQQEAPETCSTLTFLEMLQPPEVAQGPLGSYLLNRETGLWGTALRREANCQDASATVRSHF